MQNIKLIIFDLDGTLVDAYAAINNSFNYVLRRLGLKPQRADSIRRSVGWGDLNLLKPYVPGRDLKRALSLYRKHHKHSLLKHSHLYPHAGPLLRQLKAEGYKLAVASNRPTEFSLILLRHLRLIDLFDYLLCADKLKYGKPNPEILNKIIKRLAFKKSQVLYVGDMAIDAQAGRRAKVKTGIISGGSSSDLEMKREKPFRVIPSIGKLAGLLVSLDSQVNR